MKICYSLVPEALSYNFRTPRMLAHKASKVQKSGHFCCFLSNDMAQSDPLFLFFGPRLRRCRSNWRSEQWGVLSTTHVLSNITRDMFTWTIAGHYNLMATVDSAKLSVPSRPPQLDVIFSFNTSWGGHVRDRDPLLVSS